MNFVRHMLVHFPMKWSLSSTILITIVVIFSSVFGESEEKHVMDKQVTGEKATFGAGCFWCVEAIFEEISGVHEAVSGYSGGQVKNPSYREVCTGTTGHAEVIQVTYDPAQVSYEKLLEAFFLSHDPTQLNRQGADVGTQYRSVIFYHNEEQKVLAKRVKERLNTTGAYDSEVVTEISPLKNFYEAEEYHQGYFEQNRQQPYCSMVISPKLEKFKKAFK